MIKTDDRIYTEDFAINLKKKTKLSVKYLLNLINLDYINLLKKKYLISNLIDFSNFYKNNILWKNKFNIFFKKSNTHLSAVSGNFLLFNLSIGKYIKLVGPSVALWKKKNNKYKKLIFEFFIKILLKTKFKISFVFIKNIKNSFFLVIKYFKYLKYRYLIIKDTIYYTKIKQKKKTYIKRRISRKLNYINPLKV